MIEKGFVYFGDSDEVRQLLKEAANDPAHVALLREADEVANVAALNELIETINRLLKEVDTMPIASHFPSDRGINEQTSIFFPLNPKLRGLSQAEFKRETIRIALERLRDKVIGVCGELRGIVLDMKVTQQEM